MGQLNCCPIKLVYPKTILKINKMLISKLGVPAHTPVRSLAGRHYLVDDVHANREVLDACSSLQAGPCPRIPPL